MDTHVEGEEMVHTNFDLFVEFMHRPEQKTQMLGRNMIEKKSVGKKWQHCASRLHDAIMDESDALSQWDQVAIPLEMINTWVHGRVKDIGISHVWVYFMKKVRNLATFEKQRPSGSGKDLGWQEQICPGGPTAQARNEHI